MAAGVDRGCSIRSLFFHQLHTVLQQECLSSLLHEEVNFDGRGHVRENPSKLRQAGFQTVKWQSKVNLVNCHNRTACWDLQGY